MKTLPLHVGLALLLAGSVARAQDLSIVDPNSTGIPGEEIRYVTWAPDGDLWVAARWPFWGEGGIGVYDGDLEAWTVWSSAETPIPSEFVNDIEFDASGAAWIATGGGLVRWDGATWTVWDSFNSPMAHDVVADISIAPDGHVWVNNSTTSTGGDAVWDFDGVASWVGHSVPGELPFAAPWTTLSQVFVDSSGHVWAANNTLNGVAEYDGRDWTLHGGDLDRFDEMAEDQFGNLWLNTNMVGSGFAFYRFDGQTFTKYPTASSTTLTSDPEDGTIYVGNWHGTVLRTSDGGQTIETYLTGLNKVFSIAPDPAGTDVWIGTIGAVGHFTGAGALVHDYNTYNTGMPWYWVDYFDTDRDGNFWVATGEAGLSRFDGLRWRNWGEHNAGSEPYPFAGNEPMSGVYQDSQGTHWFGGNGIARWDSQTGQFTGFWNWQNNPGMGVTQFPFFAEDAAGNLFAASEYGTTFRFDPVASLWVKEPVQPYAVLGLPRMRADSKGDVWIAGWFDIHHWDGATWTVVTLPQSNYFFDLGGINEMAIAPGDVFWFATNEGLVRWDGKTFTHYDAASIPLPGPLVRGIDVRADGMLGISARGGGGSDPSGVSVVDGDIADPASWTTWFYGQSSLPHWQIERCAFDPEGRLWVSALSEGTAVVEVGAWENLAQSLEGTHGAPHLQASGLPVGGGTMTLTLTNALEGAAGAHVVGVSSLSLPIFGGVLVPSPSLLLSFVADAQGKATTTGIWPSGPAAGTQTWFQSWVLDPGGVQGLSASNAVVCTVP